MNSIPYFTTFDLKKYFFKEDAAIEKLYTQNAENFFIAPFSAFKKQIKLPVPYYRRSVTQIYVVTKGTAKKRCNLNQVTIATGQAHLWLQDQISAVDWLSDDIEGYFLHFSQEFILQSQHTTRVFEDFLPLNQYMESQAITLDTETQQILIQNLERMHYMHIHNFSEKIIRSYLLTILYEINHLLPKQTDHLITINKHSDLVHNFKKLLIENITKEQSVAFYSEKLNVSPNHLNKTVKSLTGKSTKTWINDVLLIGAKILLVQSELTVNEIAFTLGFSDPSYFNRFFKKHTGVSPFVYMNHNKD